MLSIKGVYAAAVTPRRLGMQDINLGVMWDVFDFLIERGVDGIVLLGSTGEFLHYSTAERMRMMGLAPKRSRVPVIINVSHSTLDGTVELAQAAAASGAAGVLVMPPYFFRYGAADVASFYEQFFEEAALSIPVLLYHIPVFTNPIPFEVAEQLLRNGVAHGVKDSSGDADYARKLADLRAASPFASLMGNDALFPDARRAHSIDAVVSGIASAVPELLVALNRAIEKNAQEVVTRLETRLNQFIAWTDKLPVPVCIREAASARGLQLGPHAIPAGSEQERVVSELREWFKPWLADVQRECKHA